MQVPGATNDHGMTDMEWLEREQEKEMIEFALERSLNDFQGSQTLHTNPPSQLRQPLHSSMPTMQHNGYDPYPGGSRRNVSSHSLDLHQAHHQSFSHPHQQPPHRPAHDDRLSHRHSSYNNRQPDMYRGNPLYDNVRGMEGRENSMRSLASSTNSPIVHRPRASVSVREYPRSASFRGEVEEMTETVVDSPHHTYSRMGAASEPNFHHGRMSPGPMHPRYSYPSAPSGSAPTTPYAVRPSIGTNFGRRSLPEYHNRPVVERTPREILENPRYEARNAVIATARQHLSEEEAILVEQALNLAINPHQRRIAAHQPVSTDTQHSGGSHSSYGSRGRYPNRMDNGPPPSPPQQGSQASTLSAQETMDLLLRASALEHLSQEELDEIEQALHDNDRRARHDNNEQIIVKRSSHSSAARQPQQQHLHHLPVQRDYPAQHSSHSDGHLMPHHHQQHFPLHQQQQQQQQHMQRSTTHSDPAAPLNPRSSRGDDPYHRNSDPRISSHPRGESYSPRPQPQPPRNYRPNPRFAATTSTPRRTYSGDSLAMAKEEINRAMAANTLSQEEYAELMMALEGNNNNSGNRSRSPPNPTSPFNSSRRARPRNISPRVSAKGLPGRSISYDSATNNSTGNGSHQSRDNKTRSWGDRPPRVAPTRGAPRRSASYDSVSDWQQGPESRGDGSAKSERTPIIPRHDWSPQRRRSSISSSASHQVLAEIKELAESEPVPPTDVADDTETAPEQQTNFESTVPPIPLENDSTNEMHQHAEPVPSEEGSDTEEIRDEQEESSLQSKEEPKESAETEKGVDSPKDDVRENAEDEEEEEEATQSKETELDEQLDKVQTAEENNDSQQFEGSGSFSSSSTRQTPRVFDLPPSNRQARLGSSQHSRNNRQPKLSAALAALPYARAPGSVCVDLDYSVSQFGDSVNTFGSDTLFLNQHKGEESVFSIVSSDTDNSRQQASLAMSPHTVTSKGTVRGVALLPPALFDNQEEEDEEEAENVLGGITEESPSMSTPTRSSVASEKTRARNNQVIVEEEQEVKPDKEVSPQPATNESQSIRDDNVVDEVSERLDELSVSASSHGEPPVTTTAKDHAPVEQKSKRTDETSREDDARVDPAENWDNQRPETTATAEKPQTARDVEDQAEPIDAKGLDSISERPDEARAAQRVEDENDQQGEDNFHQQSQHTVRRNDHVGQTHTDQRVDRHGEDPDVAFRGDSYHLGGQQDSTQDWRQGQRRGDEHQDQEHDDNHHSPNHRRRRWEDEHRRGTNEFDFHQRDTIREHPHMGLGRDRRSHEGDFVNDREHQSPGRRGPYDNEQFERHRRDPQDDDLGRDETDIPPAVPQQVQVEQRNRREAWISQGRQNSVSSLGESTQYSIFSSHFRQDDYERYRKEDYERAMYERNSWRPSQPPPLPAAMRETPSRYYEPSPSEGDHMRRSRMQQQHPSASSHEFSRAIEYRGTLDVQANSIPEHDRFDEDLKRALYLSMQMQRDSLPEAGERYEHDIEPVDSRLTRDKLDLINRALSGSEDLRGSEPMQSTHDRFPGAPENQYDDRRLRHDDRSPPLTRDCSDPTHDRISPRTPYGAPIESNPTAMSEAMSIPACPQDAISSEAAALELALQQAKDDEERQSIRLARQLQEEEERRASMERGGTSRDSTERHSSVSSDQQRGRFSSAGQMPEVPFSAVPGNRPNQVGARRSSSPERGHPSSQQSRANPVGAVRSSSPDRVRHPLDDSYASLHQSRGSQVGAVRSSSPERLRHPLEDSYSSMALGRSSSQIGAVRSTSPDPATRHPLEESISSLNQGISSQVATGRTVSPVRKHRAVEEPLSPGRSPRGSERQTFEESYTSHHSSRYLGGSSRGSLFSTRASQSQRHDQSLPAHGESYSSELSPDHNEDLSPRALHAATPPASDRSFEPPDSRSGLGGSTSSKERHPLSLSERQQSLRLSDLSRQSNTGLAPLSPPFSRKKLGKDATQANAATISPHPGEKKSRQTRRDSKVLGSVKKGVSSLMWKLGSSRKMGSSQNLLSGSSQNLISGSTADAPASREMDADTRIQIQRAIGKGIISQLHGVVRTGKEATIYYAEKGPKSNGFDVAVKVYKRGGGDMGDDSQRDLPQFQNISSERQLELWTIKEFRNLQKARKFGIPSPAPIFTKNNILFMQFMGTDGRPAPQLGELDLRRNNKLWKTLYKQIVEAIRRLYTTAMLVHGSLNETNILVVPRYLIDLTLTSDSKEYEADTAVLIDFGHTVDSKHPDAIDLLRGDLQSVRQFFAKQGIRTPNVEDTLKFVTNGGTSPAGAGGDSAPLEES
ncbi:protein kinase RIO1 [Seminavis robusta]|uniref:non-specific serine/threonine protein kinase n=1 Tax=Seminavis robusta TaxID=568900 RepID=A0A9N8HHL4_9STRA|nr:protein kinase RIO1 [Seminavis robusta]|eukprot:Sro569_g168270.1 protein kinase RIO1 (2298) ;mRNA; f:4351-11321